MLNKLNISVNKKKFIVYFLLILALLAVYWHVTGYDFINFDDQGYVTENGHVQAGLTLDGIRWAFGTKYLGLWNPLVWISFMCDHQFYGLNAGGYHLTNLILHILSTLLLFWLFNRMTGAIWKSAFVAAFFALHPLHVESVAWIAERKDVLSAFFWMLTLCLYVYYVEKPDIKRYLLVFCGFVLALMSKPMVVTLPVMMILLDYWPLNRFESRKGNLLLWQLKEKLPFFVLSAILVIITLYNPHQPNIPDTPDLKQYPLHSRLANAPVAFVTYLVKTFRPYDMAIFYPFSTHIPLWQVIGSSLLVLLITALVIIMAKRLPCLFAGWLWFAITIAPVIGIIQISITTPYAMADRYHYLPSIGIAMMLTWGIPSLIKDENIRKTILFPAALIFLIIISALAWKQCGYWKNSTTLFNHALQATKNNYLAHNNVGLALSKEGKNYAAVYHYNKAIRLNPDRAFPYNNRGLIYGKSGQYQLALEDFHKAIRLKSDYMEAYNNRGIVYTKRGLYRQALDDFNKALLIKPDYADAYNNRAFVYFSQGDNISGCRDARRSCELGNCTVLKSYKEKSPCN
ncbi:MAG: tetratricopeptide repeat protein [Smithella sp.]|jgi:Tfp pilus assembly protein PilF